MKLLMILAALIAAPALAAPEVGKPAPSFSVVDTMGNAVNLAELKGSPVVIEWTNHQCPFVKKFYKNGDMQGFQKTAATDGVKWLRVVSSAPGKQGYVSAEEANQIKADKSISDAHTILDPTGELGRQYAAKTTPHMYVINAEGTLVYQGAIDDKASADSGDIEGANNYVMAALGALKAGSMPEVKETRAYGCTVKY